MTTDRRAHLHPGTISSQPSSFHPGTPRCRSRLPALLAMILLLAGCAAGTVGPETGDRRPDAGEGFQGEERLDEDSLGRVRPGGYFEDFPDPADIRAAGVYRGERKWDFESFSALELEPSETAVFRVFKLDLENEVVIDEKEPGLLPNDEAVEGEPFYRRGRGAISAIGWTDEAFADVRVNAILNSQGGPRREGSKSRQGVMARWNDGNLYYWFYIDFASGKYEILRSEGLGIFEPFLDSTGRVRDFDDRRQYFLSFEVVEGRLRGRVFEVTRGGAIGRQVGDTGVVADPEPLSGGLTGFVVELSLGAPFTPLEGSIARIAASPLSGRQPRPRPLPSAANVREGRKLAREGIELAREGELERSVELLREAVEADPRAHRALTALAWIRATAEDPTLRAPEESLELATRALDALMQDFNRGRNEVEPEDFVRTANALAAANAALGNFAPEPVSREELRRRGMEPAAGLELGAVLQAVSDSGEVAAATTWSQFASEVARGLESTPANRELLRTTEQVFEQVRAERAVVGMPVQ